MSQDQFLTTLIILAVTAGSSIVAGNICFNCGYAWGKLSKYEVPIDGK